MAMPPVTIFAMSVLISNSLMTAVRFKERSMIVMSVAFFLLSMSSMSPVDFQKWPWRPDKFKGQGPFHTCTGVSAGKASGEASGEASGLVSVPPGESLLLIQASVV